MQLNYTYFVSYNYKCLNEEYGFGNSTIETSGLLENLSEIREAEAQIIRNIKRDLPKMKIENIVIMNFIKL